MPDPDLASQHPSAESSGCLPALLRLTWLLFGNIALLLCAALVAQRPSVAMDLAFFGVALALVAIRYVDIALFKGRTSEGAPATLSHWARHAALVGAGSLALWALARTAAAKGWL